MKYEEVEDLNFKDMLTEEKIEYEAVSKKVLQLQKQLQEMLTDEQFKILDKCFDAMVEQSSLEDRYIFDHGVKAGLNELSFIKEALGGVIIS